VSIDCRFCRGSVQTILPANRNWRAGRLCTSLEEKITEMEQEATEIKQINSERLDRKRKLFADRDSIDLELRQLKVKFKLLCSFL
jgi:structural maintenance of chromosomes protein 6